MEFIRSQSIEHSYYPGRVLIIYGPRRVGKTTLLTRYLETKTNAKIQLVNGDDLRVQDIFRKQSVDALRQFASPYDIIAIDEAQQLPQVGLNAKMLIDTLPDKQILLTGSSSFELAGQVGEPLTGRHFTLTLLPIAQSEFTASQTELHWNLEQFLIYGSYPEVVLTNDTTERERILRELSSSYLYKDILALDNLKYPELVRNIAKMLALQIGQEVSLTEIANTLDVTVPTVQRYVDILEKMFVIKKVHGFSRNLRNEIHKKARYYFLDNGVRNAVIGQFSPLDSRNDVGALWENFIFTELLKRDTIADVQSDFYFWRTHTGSEIDIVREQGGQISTFECKWSSRKKTKQPKMFAKAYPEATFAVIHPENYLDFLL